MSGNNLVPLQIAFVKQCIIYVKQESLSNTGRFGFSILPTDMKILSMSGVKYANGSRLISILWSKLVLLSLVNFLENNQPIQNVKEKKTQLAFFLPGSEAVQPCPAEVDSCTVDSCTANDW